MIIHYRKYSTDEWVKSRNINEIMFPPRFAKLLKMWMWANGEKWKHKMRSFCLLTESYLKSESIPGAGDFPTWKFKQELQYNFDKAMGWWCTECENGVRTVDCLIQHPYVFPRLSVPWAPHCLIDNITNTIFYIIDGGSLGSYGCASDKLLRALSLNVLSYTIPHIHTNKNTLISI